MIVRIVGEGQWRVPDQELARMNVLDELLAEAVREGDAEELPSILDELDCHVRKVGIEVDDGQVHLSDVILPNPSTPFDEIADWIRDSVHEEGLIPG